jgi:serine/threonine-protein kinase
MLPASSEGSAVTQVGRYQLVSKLATGGMAEVFLAKVSGPMGFEKTLVLKRILPHLAEDPQFVEMFLSEARLAAQLNHPGIVQIFDFGESEGAYYLAMEYIDGCNLRTLAKKTRQSGRELPPPLCAKIVSVACDALAFAHAFVDPGTRKPLQLIHRDISPDNLLVSRQGGVKVVDFGIAKAANQSHKTQTGLVKGKIAYMPPEQLQARPLDQRVDVYALGMVLYELLTGHRPFDDTTDEGMMRAILYEPFVPAASRRPDLPHSLAKILDKVLAKAREQRYPDCRSLQSDLERYILSTGEPVGPWELAQFVTEVLETPAVPVPMSVVTASISALTEPDKPVEGQSPHGPAVNTVSLRKGTPTRHSRPEEPAHVTPKRRMGPFVVLSALGLFMAGGGVLLFGEKPKPEMHASTGSNSPVALPANSGTPLPETPGLESAPPDSGTPPSGLEDGGTSEDGGLPVDGGMPEDPGVASPLPQPGEPALPPKRAKGSLRIFVRPYAIVKLDGRLLGDTPFSQPFEVSAGSHQLQLTNPELGKTVTRTIKVKAGQPTTFKFNFNTEEP